MEKRVLGKTAEMLSIVGFGGIIAADEDQRDANNYVAEAIDAGVNYFDVAPTYSNAEDKLGIALEGKRKDLFLACKTENRTKDGAQKLLEQSLRKLKTDYFDLYQFHAVTTAEDVERIFGVNGAMETFQWAKQRGYIKHIGFSAHSEEAALALMENFNFDSILFPVNWVNLIKAGFGVKVLEKAEEKDLGILAIKAMAKTSLKEGAVNKYPKGWYEAIDDKELAQLAYRYTLSKNITSAITPGNIEHFRWALEAVQNFKPVTEDEEKELISRAEQLVPLFPLAK
jgi:predicted aldo/keto reductase-like oxidoreductase